MVVLTCPAAVVAEQALMTTFLPAEALMNTFLPAAAAAPPPQMTAEGAVWQAGAEGLTLLRSDNVTGYRGVYFATRASLPYEAKVWRGDKNVYLGCFATVEEAALTFAQTPEAQAAVAAAAAAPPAPPPMTAEEAVRQADAEGLTLLKANNTAGYKGVSYDRIRAKPYKAEVRRGGKQVHLGTFATPEEAALCYAKTVAEQSSMVDAWLNL